MQRFFIINEDFSYIIKKALKEKMNVNQINNISNISTGWTNIVYKVETDNGNYYLRFPRDEFWSKTIIKDYQFASYIKGKTSFDTVDLKLAYEGERPFSIHKEIPGVTLADKMDDLNDEEIENVSKQISKFMYELHNIKFGNDKIFSVNDIGLDLQDFIDELLNKHVSNEDKVFWSSENFKINKDDNNVCLVHGDLNSSNIILDDNNNVRAIIDFGFGGYGNKYFDISRIIGRCPEKFKQPIINSYQSFENKKINNEELEKDINIWHNIDQSYINYMTKIGIYKSNID